MDWDTVKKGRLTHNNQPNIQLIVHDRIKNQILLCNDENSGNTSFAEERNLFTRKCCNILDSTKQFSA